MTVTGHIDRDVAALPDVMRLVDSFFASSAGNPQARFAVELALEEIFTNMVKYNAAGAGRINIELASRDGSVVVTVTDPDAHRFDPFTEAAQVDVDQPLDQRTPGGLGIHLVKKMMDRIEYSHAGRTATITLHKRMD
jgi:anti-sigma regulatory factor (Ser/Thr protein kinase)